nr:hypothetical protein [Tanacetum cinerariifolium]
MDHCEAEAVQIILTGIDNDIYSTVDACPNVIDMWKAIETLKKGQDLKNVSYHKLYDILKQHHNDVNEIRAERLVHHKLLPATEGKKEIDKLMDLILMYFKKIYKPTDNNLKTSSNTKNLNVDNPLRSYRGIWHVVREFKKVKQAWDSAYHKEKMLLYQVLEAHYMYMEKIQEVTSNAVDNSRPIFDAEPLQKLVDIVLLIISTGYSKHMTGNLKLLRVSKNPNSNDEHRRNPTDSSDDLITFTSTTLETSTRSNRSSTIESFFVAGMVVRGRKNNETRWGCWWNDVDEGGGGCDGWPKAVRGGDDGLEMAAGW